MRWLLICLAIAGCARAGQENRIIGGLSDAGPRGDAGDFPLPDASTIDAPPQQITLAQTASSAITRDNTFSCQDTTTGVSAQNSYYRVFAPGDYGITTTLHLTEVAFGIQKADAGPSATQQPATVIVGTYAVAPEGTTLDPAQIRTIRSVDIQIPNAAGITMTVPIAADVSPTTNLIIELAVPDGSAAQSMFVIGSNGQGERQPGYTSAPGCSLTDPTTMLSVAKANKFDEADVLLTATGTY